MTWRQIEIEHRGRQISGSYSYDPDMQLVEVKTANGVYKATQLGGSQPELLAARLLTELADDARA